MSNEPSPAKQQQQKKQKRRKKTRKDDAMKEQQQRKETTMQPQPLETKLMLSFLGGCYCCCWILLRWHSSSSCWPLLRSRVCCPT